jgi:hypothetical protein
MYLLQVDVEGICHGLAEEWEDVAESSQLLLNGPPNGYGLLGEFLSYNRAIQVELVDEEFIGVEHLHVERLERLAGEIFQVEGDDGLGRALDSGSQYVPVFGMSP